MENVSRKSKNNQEYKSKTDQEYKSRLNQSTIGGGELMRLSFSLPILFSLSCAVFIPLSFFMNLSHTHFNTHKPIQHPN